MKAAVIYEFGPADVLKIEDLPPPVALEHVALPLLARGGDDSRTELLRHERGDKAKPRGR